MTDSDQMFKLSYKELAIEVTRRCNMQCSHCMRGSAENHTISKEVVDRLFDEVSVVARLLLTGGEPFLEPEMMDYIFDAIIKRKIPIEKISVVTNGTIRDKRIAESFNKIGKYVADNWSKTLTKKQIRQIVTISISNDSYHMKEDIMETLKFYRGLLNDNCIILKKNQKDINEVLCLGNAADESFVLDEKKKYMYKITPYRVAFFNDDDGKPLAIDTMIQIGYDGKILIGEDSSYLQQDNNNYGNILQKHMSTLLAECAFDEPFTEDEAHMRDTLYTLYKNEDFTEMSKETMQHLLATYEFVYCARERYHKAYPSLKFEDVIEVAYHDMNVHLREVVGTGFMLCRIDDWQEFKVPVKESQQILDGLSILHPFQTLYARTHIFNKPLECIPDKVSGERERRGYLIPDGNGISA